MKFLLLAAVILFLAWRAIRLLAKDSNQDSPDADLQLDTLLEQPSIVPPPLPEPEADDEVTDAMLEKADPYVAMGESLDVICRFIQPDYAAWSSQRQHKYRSKVDTCLRARPKRE